MSTRTPIEVLADLFEGDEVVRLVDLKRQLGSAFAPLKDQGVIIAASDVMLWRCRTCGEVHEVEPAPPGQAGYRCYCDSYGSRLIDGFDPRHGKLSPGAFAKAVFAAVLARGDIRTREHIVGQAWEGGTSTGRLSRPLVLARQMDDLATFNKVRRLLRRIGSGGRSILVTASSVAASEPSLDDIDVLEPARDLVLSSEGIGVADGAAKRVRAAVAGLALGRPDKGRDRALALFVERAEKGETEANLGLEAQVIADLIGEVRGEDAPKKRTVEDWIRDPYWERFPDRRR